MFLDKPSTLDEHATGTTGRVEHAAMVRFKDLHDQADDAAWRKKLSAFLSFRAGELTEKIFVDSAEGVVFESVGNLRNFLEQFFKQGTVENLIGAWQHAGELRIVLLDIGYRFVYLLADVFAFRQTEQPVIASVRSQIDHAF